MYAEAAIERWLNNIDDEACEELRACTNDESLLEDAFRCDLAFGTGGLRGIIGIGPNRMNVYTVAKATQGLANYLKKRYEEPSVAVARDSRNMGDAFCRVIACVLASNGIKAFLYPRIEPTPALSFAVRDLDCSAGICVTASHNPAKYNGYKVYGSDGCQITTTAAKDIQACIDAVDVFDDVAKIDFEEALSQGWISWICDDVIDRYIEGCYAASLNSATKDLRLVYSPLHGAGLECVSKILERIGIADVTVEPNQAIPDGNFPTCPYPNPEIREALEYGLALASELLPDLLLATDPDADRVGIAVIKDGQPVLLTGNEVGVLLTDYVCNMLEASGESLHDKVIITTIVSTAMVDSLCEDRGFELRRTLTGFKFIGEQIGLLEAQGRPNDFAFGFEESYGYLAGTHVRDKDAVVASMLICEMAQWYKSKGMDLIDGMNALYQRYGYYKNELISIEYPGAKGAKKIASIIAGLRTTVPTNIAGLRVDNCVDYGLCASMPISGGHGNAKAQMLPSSDVLEFNLEGGNKFIVRPSGTEPKVKVYLFSRGSTEDEADELLLHMGKAIRLLLE